jgi:hypothetical protein
VRAAAALTLAKIDRYESLLVVFFDHLQPMITEADECLVATKDEVKCRDQFWRRVNESRLQLVTGLNDEEIELSYAPLFGYHRDIYEKFRLAIASVKQCEEKEFWSLLNDCQTSILQMSENQIFSAALGNKLRAICAQHQDRYVLDLDQLLEPIRDFLKEIVLSSDDRIKENQTIPGQARRSRRS